MTEPSSLVRRFSPLLLVGNGPILDVPCGFGRNAIHLATLGAHVHCLDINQKALDSIECFSQANAGLIDGELVTIQMDLRKHWSIEKETYQAIVCVDFILPALLPSFIECTKPGGIILIESFGNRGGNYTELPRRGEYFKALEKAVEFRFYDEKPAGPARQERVTVKLVAIKL